VLATGKKIILTLPLNPQFGYGVKPKVSGNLEIRVIRDKKIYNLYLLKN
jgi:hypothetical protein